MRIKRCLQIGMLSLCPLAGCASAPDEVLRPAEERQILSDVSGTYMGRLGIYQQFVVLSLNEESGSIHGAYFYARHGKLLELAGTWDSVKEIGVMTESWQGQPTGSFTFEKTDSGMKGTWVDANGAGPASFQFLKLSGTVSNLRDDTLPRRGFYERRHRSWLWIDDEHGKAVQKHFDTLSWLRIVPLSSQAFAFHNYVVGSNAHQGRVEGIAFWLDETTAIHVQSDGYVPESGPGVIRFEFSGEEVRVLPIQSCDHFGGARIGIPEGRYRLGRE